MTSMFALPDMECCFLVLGRRETYLVVVSRVPLFLEIAHPYFFLTGHALLLLNRSSHNTRQALTSFASLC